MTHPSPRLHRHVLLSTLFLFALLPARVRAATPEPVRAGVQEVVDRELSGLLDDYRHIHSHPEISFQEKNTAAYLAAALRKVGFDVATEVGGHGIVGVLRNGDGPTVLVRTDMDALPVKELTGLPFASEATTRDDQGNEVPVMHACGHDINMTCWLGAARTLTRLKQHWSGTLVMIGQPAEERGAGANAMLNDGLFKRFPLPDYCVALHVNADTPAGTVGYVPGFAMANVDSVDITLRGVGGHGAFPHSTKDPIVLAAQTVLALQTIVSREINPTEPAVITVGSIHGGTKHNIIPDEVRLQLTLRSYTDEVREQTIAAIRRLARGLAVAAGIPEDRLPVVTVKDEFTPAAYNDPELTERLAGVFKTWLGEGNVYRRQPVMGGEDFGRYGRTEHKIPICMFSLGGVSSESVKASLASGKGLPSLHSAVFAPDSEPAIRTGVTAMSAAVLDLLGQK